MPARFQKHGIAFQYPENWTLGEEESGPGTDAVTVYSPGGAFWSVAMHPPSEDPLKLAGTALGAMKQEYPNLDSEEKFESVAGRDLVGFDLNFYYLDLISTVQIRCLRAGGHTYTIFCQGEDREFDQVSPVFQAITTSLLRELGGWDEPSE